MNLAIDDQHRELGDVLFRIKGTTETFRINTSQLLTYPDGFSFRVESEIDALRAAYVYRYSKRVTIEQTRMGWRVAVYRADASATLAGP